MTTLHCVVAVLQDTLRQQQQHQMEVEGAMSHLEAHHRYWDKVKVHKPSMSTGRNVIALSAVAGGSLMPFQVGFSFFLNPV